MTKLRVIHRRACFTRKACGIHRRIQGVQNRCNVSGVLASKDINPFGASGGKTDDLFLSCTVFATRSNPEYVRDGRMIHAVARLHARQGA